MINSVITIGSDYGGLERVLIFHGPTRGDDAEEQFNKEVDKYIEDCITDHFDKPDSYTSPESVKAYLLKAGILKEDKLYNPDDNGFYIRLHRDIITITYRGN